MTRKVHSNRSHQQISRPPRKNKSDLSERKIEEKRSFFDSTMGKVVAISLIVLFVAVASIGLVNYNSQTSDPLSTGESTRIYEHLQTEPLVKFEPYVPGFVHNGLWMVQTNRPDAYACQITSSLNEFETCELYGEYGRALAYSDASMRTQAFSNQAYNSKGLKVHVQDVNISLGVNPQLRNNYEWALKIAEHTVLQPDFADSDIEKILKQINGALVHGLHDFHDNPIIGGSYREGAVAIQPDDVAEDPEKLKVLVEQRNGKNTFDTFIRAARKFYYTDSLSSMTAKERKIFKSMYHTCPPAKKVPQLMQKFAADYRQKLKEGVEAFELAAWVHMTFVSIHPYEDAMGREARILMNAELKRSGYLSVEFLDDKAYTKAIQRDHKHPGAFRDYLVEAYKHSPALNEVQDFPGPV